MRAIEPVAFVALALALLGCSAGASSNGTPAQSSAVAPTGSSVTELRPPPGAPQHCSGSVAPTPPWPPIAWTAWHLAASPEAVAAQYMRELGAENHAREGGEDLWRFPTVAEPERVLTVTGATQPGPWTSCGSPPAGAQTIVMISNSPRASP